MKDILTFKTMITPIIVQILFWLGILGILITGIQAMNNPFKGGLLYGLVIIIGGSLMWRVYCELMIVLFNLNKNVQSIASSKE